MKPRIHRNHSAAGVIVVGAAMLLAACSGETATTATTASALSTALVSATSSSGTLLCAPVQDQITACSGLATGASCSLTQANGGAAIAGTCRTALDGVTVACAPVPPAPPQALVDACGGKASGDTCQVTEAFGNLRDGVCMTARDGSTLVCGRVHTPPQAVIDACSGQSTGASCTLPAPDGGTSTATGVCSLGPVGTGPMACARADALLPNGMNACSGLAEGATCSMGRGMEMATGTCTTPAAGGSAVCVMACGQLGHPFDGGPHGGMGPHGPGMGPGTGPGMGPGM